MTDEQLFRLLVERTRVLATVCDNAAEVLSEEFKDMITGPLAAVQAVLADCPDAEVWQGDFKEEDIVVDVYRHELQRFGEPVSVRVRHVPTDLSVESYSKSTREENERVAKRALADRVGYEWDRRQRGQQGIVPGPRPARSRL